MLVKQDVSCSLIREWHAGWSELVIQVRRTCPVSHSGCVMLVNQDVSLVKDDMQSGQVILVNPDVSC